MTTLGGKATSWADLSSTYDKGSPEFRMVNMLGQENLLRTAGLWKPTNHASGHHTHVLVSEPDVYIKRFGDGVPPSIIQYTEIVDGYCGFQSRSALDVDFTRIYGKKAAANERAKRGLAMLSAHNKRHSEMLIYGNQGDDPGECNGFATRYGSITAGVTKENVLSCGGTTNLTSAYVACFGEDFHFLYPLNTQMGVLHTPLTDDMVTQTVGIEGKEVYCNRDLWDSWCGLASPAWNQGGRVCNIDLVAMRAGTGTQAPTAVTFAPDMIADALNKIPGVRAAIKQHRVKIIVSPLFFGYLRRAAKFAANNTINISQVAGEWVMDILGAEVVIEEQVLNTEAQVT